MTVVHVMVPYAIRRRRVGRCDCGGGNLLRYERLLGLNGRVDRFDALSLHAGVHYVAEHRVRGHLEGLGRSLCRKSKQEGRSTGTTEVSESCQQSNNAVSTRIESSQRPKQTTEVEIQSQEIESV
ncbi:hypothetical protein PENTCL1PPCAC_28527, partial [Pristionchus entomophagus]